MEDRVSMTINKAGAAFLLLFAGSALEAQEYPTDQGWEFAERPLQRGWDQSRLDYLHKFIHDSTQMTSFMVVRHGKLRFQHFIQTLFAQPLTFHQRDDEFRVADCVGVKGSRRIEIA